MQVNADDSTRGFSQSLNTAFADFSPGAPVAGGTPGLWRGRLIGRHGHSGNDLGSGDVVPDLWHDGRPRLPQPVQQRQYRRQLRQRGCRRNQGSHSCPD